MDAPIYIHHLFCRDGENSMPVRNRLYVIEGRDGTTSGIEEIVLTDKDRIGVYHLPDLDDTLMGCSMFVTRSRLFIVGPFFLEGKVEEEGIRHLTFDSPSSSWEKTPLGDDFRYVAGMTVFNGNQMVCFGPRGKNFSFLPTMTSLGSHHSTFRFLSPLPTTMLGFLVLLLTPPTAGFTFWHSPEPLGEIGYYQDGEWHTIDAAARRPSLSKGAVVVNDKYLITYADYHPLTQKYAPNLYVCDISSRVGCQWLPEPVMGLLNDDTSLPSPTPDDPILAHSSLMRVSQDKFAFIWSRTEEGPRPPGERTIPPSYLKLQCTKFTLSVEDGGDAVHPIFRAHLCSSIDCACHGVTLNVHSTLINPNPPSFKVITSTMLPLKRKSQALDSAHEHKGGSSCALAS